MKSKLLFAVFAMFIFAVPMASAILPEKPTSMGGYYILTLSNVEVLAIYNNTQFCVDANKDMVCDSDKTYNINKGQTQSVSLSDTAFLFADKPVLVTEYSDSWNSGCACSGRGIWGYAYRYLTPSAAQLGTEYYTSGLSNAIITASQYLTNITIENTTGSYNYILSAPADQLNLTNPELATKIISNKPVMVTEYSTPWNSGCGSCGSYSVWGYGYAYSTPSAAQLGTEYYTCLADVVITITQNNTNVYVDTDRDGVADSTYNLNRTKNQSITPPIGTRITSDKPIIVTEYEAWNGGCSSNIIRGYGYGYSTPSAAQLGTEYYTKLPNVVITASQYLTNITVKNSTGSFTHSLDTPSEPITLSNAEIGTKITSDKPIMVTEYKEWNSGSRCYYGYVYYDSWAYAYGYSTPPLSPSVIMKTSPRIVGIDEVSNVSGVLFNPTSETLYNTTLTFNISSNFTTVGPVGNANVTIYKKYAHNDTIITQVGPVSRPYVVAGENKEFNVTYSDYSLLEEIKSDQHIQADVQVYTDKTGYYVMDVAGNWTALGIKW